MLQSFRSFRSPRSFRSMIPCIIFTGGGTTGHVTKNIIVMEALRKLHPELEFHYLGSKQGKEVELVGKDLATFHAISSGKLRRYFALETIPDFFRFLAGIWQSFWLIGKLKPRLVFSSGGFVALPVAIGAWLRRVPVVTHETDSYPGLANRLIGRIATKILLGYESARGYFEISRKKFPLLRGLGGEKSSSSHPPTPLEGGERPIQSSGIIFTGNPVSPKLFEGSRERGLAKLGFDPHRKTILVMGGSQGAQQINELIWEILPKLIEDGWQVVHLTGAGKGLKGTNGTEGTEENPSHPLSPPYPSYRSFEYVTTDYPDFLMAADLVISRAGGNSLAEIEALGKRAILIPLPLPAAAGDHQRKNAEEMLKKHPDWQVLANPKSEALLESVRKTSLTTSVSPVVSRGDATHTVLAEVIPLLNL